LRRASAKPQAAEKAMPEFVKYLIDAAVGFALVVALLLVFAVDSFFFGNKDENTLTNVVATEQKGRDIKRLRLAVTPTGSSVDARTQKVEKWDDMSKLLDELGQGYKHDQITMEDAINPKKLAEYDVVFLTCKEGAEDQLREPLVEYVTNGGMLYASDWRYKAIATAFPEMVVANLQHDGDKQKLDAEIVDSGLRDALHNTTIRLNFDLEQWKPAAFGGPRVKVLLKGNYVKFRAGGQKTEAPLMVKFQFGKGTVVFTSFHNEKQNSDTEKELLQYIVYSLVTAGVDAEVNTQMDKSGFTPQRSNLLSTPSSQTTEKKTYTNKKAGTLRFVLGFRNEGAELKLNITSPDGKKFSRASKSTLIVDVNDAIAGDWTYTVTAVSLPYANFPFTVTVGEKK
jgi:hypothetical protein